MWCNKLAPASRGGARGRLHGRSPASVPSRVLVDEETKSRQVDSIVTMNPCFESCKKSAGVPPAARYSARVFAPLLSS